MYLDMYISWLHQVKLSNCSYAYLFSEKNANKIKYSDVDVGRCKRFREGGAKFS